MAGTSGSQGDEEQLLCLHGGRWHRGTLRCRGWGGRRQGLGEAGVWARWIRHVRTVRGCPGHDSGLGG